MQQDNAQAKQPIYNRMANKEEIGDVAMVQTKSTWLKSCGGTLKELFKNKWLQTSINASNYKEE